ncbi:MAG TPA: hypothetical protein VNK67_09695 [Burkholderiales bacterium]|nr:hypothetical protein [Burkholderiales bacterium]
MFAAWALATGSAAAAEGPSDYSSALGRVYWGYHQVLVQKEVCDASVPAARAANDRAFAAWQQRHRALAQELQQRVTAMIRNASRDQSDYVRNLGKYEGAILQERQEYRESLLKLGSDELRAQCQAMARVLGGAEADLAKVYAAELEVIRRRK